jgi:hypothetical protein
MVGTHWHQSILRAFCEGPAWKVGRNVTTRATIAVLQVRDGLECEERRGTRVERRRSRSGVLDESCDDLGRGSGCVAESATHEHRELAIIEPRRRSRGQGEQVVVRIQERVVQERTRGLPAQA